MQQTNLLNIRDVAERLSVNRGTIYRMLARDSSFPKPIPNYPRI